MARDLQTQALYLALLLVYLMSQLVIFKLQFKMGIIEVLHSPFEKSTLRGE